ncbi:NfeD family protein [Oxalicibacterium faecigallinarum]|uniref:Membrane protein n=1 Tax=Oxalicibacterium faecigallinarum TaxID=573741 RepID=A0A8J3AL57_9BURK|nr:NfeD family protein [Oxalicibacterium faecigallinarum]GGI16617.1 membrane protein [Oxalicibacterium faecigallinarum]
MSDWMIWFAIACVLVGLEMASGTFYLLMIAIGAAAGGIAALLGLDGLAQCVVAALLAAIATFGLRRSGFAKKAVVDANRDPNVNLDVGQLLEVHAWHVVAGAAATARVRYRGALWDVELEEGGHPVAGAFVIREARGNRLIVSNV